MDNSLDTMQLDTEGFEAFGFLASETFDSSLFSSFGLNLGALFPGDSAWLCCPTISSKSGLISAQKRYTLF
jgi:hypothetical protein